MRAVIKSLLLLGGSHVLYTGNPKIRNTSFAIATEELKETRQNKKLQEP